MTPYGVTGDELRVKGKQRVIFTIKGETYTHDFCVCNVATVADAILDTDILLKMDTRLDFENGKFCVRRAENVGHDHSKEEHCESQWSAARVALMVFSYKDDRRKQ
jgi:heme/copper-type cytochrome/quinol oxidase subunit 2